jgi:dienelactone hydrolase|tara:strand:+ start:105 stop:1067 length:963 start_codon:yes stop_codon:yes gene_type:complete
MKKFLGILVLGLLVCHVGYAKPKAKKISYTSYTVESFNEIFNNDYKSKEVKLSGELYLPDKKGKFPVIYVQHGTAHPKKYKKFYDKLTTALLNEGMGVFIGDSYTKRKIKKDFWKLSLSARVLDGLVVLNTLSKHKNIDPNKIGITGYSYGGMVAFFTAYPKLLDLVTEGKQYAAHMPVYPGCDVVFKDLSMTNKPMLMLHAELDDYAPTKDCIDYVSKLKKNGTPIELKIYKNAHHGFVFAVKVTKHADVGNYRKCKPGYVDDEGYWFYNGKQWKMSYLKAMSSIYKECGGLGVTTGGTKEEQQKTIDDTAAFFKAHLK